MTLEQAARRAATAARGTCHICRRLGKPCVECQEDIDNWTPLIAAEFEPMLQCNPVATGDNLPTLTIDGFHELACEVTHNLREPSAGPDQPVTLKTWVVYRLLTLALRSYQLTEKIPRTPLILPPPEGPRMLADDLPGSY